ncbi:MAG: GFA family protein [Minisyncoccia bacterium]
MEYAEGGCYCGKVKFKVAMPALFGVHCHCTQCQRLHGTAFVTWIGFKTEDVQIEDPEKAFTKFSSGRADHGFCKNCGSSFYFRYTKTGGAVTDEWLAFTYFAMPNFTKGPDFLPTHNIFYASHPAWVENVFELPKKG